jgi:hypothetical protein
MSKALNTYVLATMTYGLIRTAPRFYDREKKYYDHKLGIQGMRQLLWSEKIGGVMVDGYSAILAWPVYLGCDIALLEVILRGRNPQDYGFDKNWERVPGIFDW